MLDPTTTTSVRNRLKRAWSPFFSRFGKLTDIQVQTIPKILDGASVVVASPTASGKTEAIVAPVAELFLTKRWQNLAVVYVVPTRALANDSLKRIEGPLADMGIGTQLKHGDKPNLSLNNPPNVLITTPESLDSLICRHPDIFVDLQTVVLDEIHLLDGTYRGDQLRILLNRLKEIVHSPDYKIHLLSASLSEPQKIAQRYSQNAQIVVVPGQREIDSYIFNSHAELCQLAKANKWLKILYFCNLRESVENLASDLAGIWDPYPVVAHHGSLSRHEREEAEHLMKEARVAMCVATSTLEIGIDIGDIDLIVLAEIPWSVSSLLQRIGRGNRREGRIRVGAVPKSNEERNILVHMLNLAVRGKLPSSDYRPDASVAIQQTFSYLYQHIGGVEEARLSNLNSPLCSKEETHLILVQLRDKGWIELRRDSWCASTRLMDLGDLGYIHSNIPDSSSLKVVDIGSGQEIGKISGSFDKTFVLARRTWQVVSSSESGIKVRMIPGGASSSPAFERIKNRAKYFALLPPEMKN